MKQILPLTRGLLLAAISISLAAVLPGRAANINWTNVAGGGWNTATNWYPNSVPSTNDTAIITIAGNYSVTLDFSPTVAGLSLGASSGSTTQSFFMGGHTLTVNGPIQVNSQGQFNLNGGALAGTNVLTGTLTWSGGSISGNTTVATNSALNIVAGGGFGFDGLVLTNYGTVNWTNTTLYGINGHNAQIYNYGLWNAQSDNTFQGAYNVGPPTLFDNFGTFLKSGHSGVTTLDTGVVFNNTGTVNVQSGTLNVNGGGTSSDGYMTTASGGTINFFSYIFTNITTFTGIGSYVAGGATFGGTIVGTLNWDGGSLTGTATIPTNSVLNIVAGGGDGFNGLVLTNYGTVNWTNTPLYGISGRNAQIYNYGLWNAQSDNSFQGAYNLGPPTLFDNFGTFLKSGHSGVSTLDSGVVFNNTGTVNVQSGTLDIGGGTSSGGNFTTATGGIVNFISTAYAFTNSTTFTGIGSYIVAGATFGGTIVGTLNWDGGILNGGMTLATNSVLNIVFAGGSGEFNGLVLTNYGTVNWTNTALYGVSGHNAQIYNYGLWNAQSDNTFTGAFNGGPATLFDNFGTFLKSGNTGLTTLDAGVLFNNTGTVTVQSGTLTINGGGTNSGSGTFTTANGGLLDLNNITFANSVTISSSTVVALGGNTTINGVLTAPYLQLVSGTLSGTSVLMGTLTWSGGAMSGVMTVASTSALNIAAGGGDGFNGLVLTNYGTVNWTNTTLYGIGGNNAQIYNYGLWNAQSDNTFQGAYNAGPPTLFDNFGTFLKSGHTGVTTLDSSVVFNNTGTVNVQSGTLNVNGGGTSSGGHMTTAGGGVINFSSYIFTNSTTFTGIGSYVAGGATFGGTIVGTLNWDGGSLAGTATLTTNSVLNIVAGGGFGFNGLVLTNYGTVNWTNTLLYGVSGRNAQIYNYGLWNAQSDNTFQGAYNLGPPTLFDNFGTFLKSGHSGVSTLDSGVVFNNTGTVNVQSGTLDIGGGTSSGGNFTTATGGIVNFISTAYAFTNSTTFTGVGSFVTSGATFGGAIVGTLSWDGGSLSGVMTLATNSVLNIVAGGGFGFNGLVLTNYGTVNWINTALYGISGNNAQIYNYGLWNAQSDNTFTGNYNGGPPTLFDNFGTFLKSGHTGVTSLDSGVVFNNTGKMDAQDGNIALQGTYTLASGTKMGFGLGGSAGNGSISLSGAASFAGSISVNLNGFFWPAVGNSFNLLSYTSETGLLFTNITLPGAGYLTWQTNYNATVFTVSVLAHIATNTTPTNLFVSQLNPTNILLQWPGDHTGWRIQAQTNQVPHGLSTNWATLPGSWLTNQFVIPVSNTNGSGFFRMIYP